MDQRVAVYGATRHDLNGKHGVATDFHGYGGDLSRDRYSVLLDSGETYKICPAQLHAEPLRFKVGSEVECQMGTEGWVPGVVVACWYREDDWPKHRPDAPYQVRLTAGADRVRLIYAPIDNNSCIRGRAASVHKAKGKGKKGRGKGGK